MVLTPPPNDHYHDDVDEQGVGVKWLRVLAYGVFITTSSGLKTTIGSLLPVSLWTVTPPSVEKDEKGEK